MEEKYAKVVVLIITNKDKDLFYMQQKDENYPIAKWRLYYTFFGGKIEENELPLESLKREMYEELQKEIARMLLGKARKVFNYDYDNGKAKRKYYVYESVLSDLDLKKIENAPIKEGKLGKIIQKKKLKDYKIVKSIKKILEKYLMENTL